jgi:hypothetical protein
VAPVLTLTPNPLDYIVKKSKIDNEYLILSPYRQRKGVGAGGGAGAASCWCGSGTLNDAASMFVLSPTPSFKVKKIRNRQASY